MRKRKTVYKNIYRFNNIPANKLVHIIVPVYLQATEASAMEEIPLDITLY